MNPGSADSISGSFRILKAGEKRASELLREKETELHRVSVRSARPRLALMRLWRPQLARALVEYETLDSEEVRRVIKGEPIRSTERVLGAEGSTAATTTTAGAVGRVGQAQTATRARGV